MKQHKPGCKGIMNCLVYHPDQDTTIHAAGGTYFEREDSERNETIDEVLQILKH